MRILVCSPDSRVVEIAHDEARIRRLAASPNARVVRERKTGRIVRINLIAMSDDTRMIVHRADPRRYSHDHEGEQNPHGCWTLRRIPTAAESLFRLAVTDCFSATPQ
jgi:hypothetical protein